MPVQTINLDRVEKQLAELFAIVERNGDVVIAQNGKPVARLASFALKKKKRITGLNRGMIWTSHDFDSPL